MALLVDGVDGTVDIPNPKCLLCDWIITTYLLTLKALIFDILKLSSLEINAMQYVILVTPDEVDKWYAICIEVPNAEITARIPTTIAL